MYYLKRLQKIQKKGRKSQLPLWLTPTQVRIIPLTKEFLEFSQKLAEKISQQNIRVDIDERNESIGKRIREAEKEWIHYILVIGEKEVNSDKLNVRDRKSGDTEELTFDSFIDKIKNETKGKPFSKLNMPIYLSQRPQIMV